MSSNSVPPRINPAVTYMDESIIREMTRVAEQADAVNLAQGFPEYPIANALHRAALDAVERGINQYTRTWGDTRLRHKLGEFLGLHYGLTYDPEEEIVITCGASEAIMATLLTLLSPGARIVIPEPIYENYLPATRLAGATPHILPVDPFTGEWDLELLNRLCANAQVMVLNTPANPNGKVWSKSELENVAEVLHRHDVTLVTDETYAWITAPDHPHTAPASVGDLWQRTVTIASFSKTYAVTGWRVGYAAAPAALMASIRKVHDFLTVCAPAPAQRALVTALDLPTSYYRDMAATYRRRCDLLRSGLEHNGWRTNNPQGGYFLLVDISDLEIADDRIWATDLAHKRGVAGVPGSAFLWDGLPNETRPPDRRGRFLRLSFGKREELIREAIERLGTPRAT